MTEYDNTNNGVVYKPYPDQQFAGSGKLNIEGTDYKIITVKESLSKGGNPVRVVYARMGVLFENDQKGNDQAPLFSGPIDTHPNLRLAAWLKEKVGLEGKVMKYMTLNVSEKQQAAAAETQPSAPIHQTDDEIPF